MDMLILKKENKKPADWLPAGAVWHGL